MDVDGKAPKKNCSIEMTVEKIGGVINMNALSVWK